MSREIIKMPKDMTREEKDIAADRVKNVWTQAYSALEALETTVYINNDNLIDIQHSLRKSVTILVKEIRTLKFG